MHPRREQILTIPPSLTIIGIIGAPHSAQFEAPRSSAWQWGQKKFTWTYLNKGLYPVLAGMVAHGLATRFGVNRFIAKMNLPVEI